MFSGLALMILLCSFSLRTTASSQVEGDVIQVKLEPVLTGLNSPLYVTSAHDGANRLFIVEQGGRIKVLQPGASTPTVFLNITPSVLSGGERGLLGLAFHPQFSTNRRFFVNFTRQPDGATVIAEFRVSENDPNLAETAGTALLLIPQPFANHNGGMVEFGPDGYLYIGMGDGGSANDPGNRAQNINELLGKILRIDVDHPNGSIPYSSPPDNPFFGATQGRDETYALGLRNPWRFSFDRRTGELYVGDVGQYAWEEIDIVTRGGNYGWRVTEGNHCNPGIGAGVCSMTGFVPAIAEYFHSAGRCSITGGYVYRGPSGTLPFGSYVYADYCTGEIFLLIGGQQSLLLNSGLNVSSFGEDERGEIYIVGLGGTVHRLVNLNAPSPLNLISAFVRHRATHELLNPITVKPNGKKFEVVARVDRFDLGGAVVVVNGQELNTEGGFLDTGDPVLIARFRRLMLSAPGPLVVEVVSAGGSRSNPVVLQVVPSGD